jgi:hypothetical protein
MKTDKADGSLPMDPIEERMCRDGVPLTRKNYLDIAYLGDPPELDPEAE